MGAESLSTRWEADEAACWAHRRVHAYRLFSLGLGPPAPYLLRLLSVGEYLGYLRQALSIDPGFRGPLDALAAFFREGEPALQVEVEYPRLFPRRVSPLGSDHGGPPAERVRTFYRETGVGPVTSPFPSDHISVETAYLAHLSEAEMWLARRGHTEDAEEHRVWAGRFRREHLEPWVPRFAREVDKTGSPFYAPLARLLTGWVTLEAELPSPEARST